MKIVKNQNSTLGIRYEYSVTVMQLFILQKLNEKEPLKFPTTNRTSSAGSNPTWVKLQYESKYRNVNYLLANSMIS